MIIGTCRLHGQLNEETGFKYASKSSNSGYRLKCNVCFEERKKRYSEENNNAPIPDVINGFCRKHGDLNKETGIICFDKTLPSGYRIRCKECVHRTRSNSYLKNREKNISYSSEWKKNNRERINELVREDKKNNPEKHKKWARDFRLRNRNSESLKRSLKQRSLDKDFYEKMVLEQDNKCAICDNNETRMARDGINVTRLCIDHDHDTNEVRQLLCHDCNSAIGKFKDCPELVLKAADYLILHKGWTE